MIMIDNDGGSIVLRVQPRPASDPKLTEEEAEWVGRDPGASLSELLASELALLANEWLDEAREIRLFERIYRVCGADQSSPWYFAEARLAILEGMLGAEAFSAAIAEQEAAWQRRFKDVEEAERNLPPCLVCGERRALASVSSQDDRICDACAHETGKPRSGPA